MNKAKQSGFTLVEIAIVLVIIGLLLGGILKGQELINSARVRNMADQNSAIQAAYFGFIDRYRQVPGDMCNQDAVDAIGQDINTTDTATCGNGRLDSGVLEEAAGVWEHLSKAGFMTGNYQGLDGGNYQSPTAAPVNAFNGYVLLGRIENAAYQGDGSERLGYVFGQQTPVNIMRELDVKLDDGRPATGVLRMTLSDGNYSPMTDSDDANCIDTDADPDIWDINTNSQDCNGVYLY
ncbi:prepilin-type N-terminal cleavage/methylation domain-containing protein [Methylohalomonas lacus]|uniref:Prepilin-type N-terminal cleavage/methylation domain-containing protein n=1 Tax=Methylohalomonas lacus TaxID=398773 RepID=A0AAE3HLH0_9GAMM|nr:prepilin-type N-terminal cleavage/methylation domain-containing protein [Methylohalomonas lacus]MCS3904429.1 prepilin-type N-terminal cleavage/methylation domain-containing protein [Methylohalomonas lacus]